MGDYILETEELEYSYPDGTKALSGASLKIGRGQKVALLGANGAGKSTLFLHFNGILKPSKGKVYFNGKPISYTKDGLMELRQKVGIVFQDPDTQLFSASVLQEISFGPMNLGLDKQDVRARVEKAMADTGITSLKDKPTHFLSYGQKKRVSIADILAMEPELIICDEPSAWLDPKHTRQIETLFKEISEKGTTVVISTHDVELAYSWADYVFVLNEGTVIGHGEPERVFADDLLLKKASLTKPWIVDITNALMLNGSLEIGVKAPKTKKELIRLLTEGKDCRRKDVMNDTGVVGDQRRDQTCISFGRERV